MRRAAVRRLRSLPFLLLSTAALQGCAGAPGDEPLGEAQAPSVCASGAVVRGVDVSVYQGKVDWPAVKADGKDFAITRISDGTKSLDSTFATNWEGIKSAGMVRGAYQYFEPGQDPVAQADIVVEKVGKLGDGDLPVTCDVETADGQSAATIVENLQIWIDRVQTGTGKVPMIYTAPGFWNSAVGSKDFADYPLWAANWGVSCPSLSTGWTDWKVWQYSATGSVDGIANAVDLDEFNGDLAALQAFAGGAPIQPSGTWGADYVSQSWPLATTVQTVVVNQEIPARITFKNIGTKTWDSNTRLGTTAPRDRQSPFVADDWVASNRPAQVEGTVAPGQTHAFQFTFRAPETPGTYDEHYGLLQEGVAWFGDPGQEGPADGSIEARFKVVEAPYHGVLVKQTFPTAKEGAVTLRPGQTVEGSITLKNVGTATWKAGVTKLAPTPRDRPSPLAASSWLSETRISSPRADVAPGESYAFPVRLTAGLPGTIVQTFSLVEESVTWFADAPKGGGPRDNGLSILIHVVDPCDAAVSRADAGADEDVVCVSAQASCQCRSTGDPGSGVGGGWLLAAGVAAVVARRRRGR